MDQKQKGFTLIEILVVVTIIGVLAGLVVVLIPKGREKANIAECTHKQGQLVKILIGLEGPKFPSKYGGVNLLLYLYRAGHLDINEDNVKLLFCPGDEIDVFDGTTLQAYKEVELEKAGEYGGLSSFAARDQTNKECRASKSSTAQQAMLADDSEDHHNNKGFVVAYSTGSVQFKQKFEDWNIEIETEVKVGEGSEIDDLKCLKTDE
jgi:prepilin-type N-terminal cleavage/methylation domain-containing protein